MGLKDSKCESCGEEVSFLFPIGILIELPSGGEEMVIRYYCKNCYDIMLDTAGDELDEKEDEEEEDEDSSSFTCACCEEINLVLNDEKKEDYFCHGCKHYICEACSEALEYDGNHGLDEHRKACKEKGVH